MKRTKMEIADDLSDQELIELIKNREYLVLRSGFRTYIQDQLESIIAKDKDSQYFQGAYDAYKNIQLNLGGEST